MNHRICLPTLLMFAILCAGGARGGNYLVESFDDLHTGLDLRQATRAAGRSGQAIAIESDQAGASLQLPEGAFPFKTGSIDFWVSLIAPWKMPASNQRHSVLQVVGTPDYWNSYSIAIQPDYQKLFFTMSSDPWSVPNRWNADQSVSCTIADWKPGEWHRVTACWDFVNAQDSSGIRLGYMALYVDGLRQGVNQKPNTITHVGTAIYLGRGPSKAPAHPVKIDELSVWDRALSPQEMDSESSDPPRMAPAKAIQRNHSAPVLCDDKTSLVTSPLAASVPRIDGNVDADEWADANETTGLLDESGRYEFDATLSTKHDGRALYVAVDALIHCAVPEASKTARTPDWGDHWVSLRCRAPNGNIQEFAIDTRGQRRQTAEGIWEGQSCVRDSGEVGGTALTFAKTCWAAEFAIPFETLARAVPAPGEVWEFDVVFTFPTGRGLTAPLRTVRWAMPKEGDGMIGAGQLRFDPASRLKSFSCDLAAAVRGKLNGSVLARGGKARIDAYAFVRFLPRQPGDTDCSTYERTFPVSYDDGEGGTRLIESALQFKQSADRIVAWGLSDVRTQALLYRRALQMTTEPSILVSPVVIYGKSLLDLTVDASLVAPAGEPVACRAQLFSADDAVAPLATWEMPPSSEGRLHAQFDIAAFAPGEYRLAVRVGDPNAPLAQVLEKIRIHPLPEWWGNALGKSDEVPKPWTPVVVSNATVDVWNRSYAFDSSPFPSRIDIASRPFLAAPMTLEVRDRAGRTTWLSATTSVAETNDMQATLRMEAASPTMKLSGTVRVEYDGFIRIDWSLSPSTNTVEVALVRLHIPIRRERALYLRAASLADFRADDYWEHYACLYPVTPGKGPMQLTVNKKWKFSAEGWLWPERFNHESWIGDDDSGLSVMFDSDRNFDTSEYMRPVSDGDTTDLQITFRNRPFSLDKPLEFSMAVQATPVKPLPHDTRRWRVGYRGEATSAGSEDLALAVRYSIFKGPGWLEMTGDGKALFERWAQGGVRLTGDNYSNISTEEMPEFQIFSKEWEIVPRIAWPFGQRGTGVMVSMKGSYADFYLWKLNRLIDQGLEGIYIDSSGVLASQNPFNDSGYTDPSGMRKSTISLFETREAYKRLYTLFKSRVPDSVIWCHPAPITALASFVDVSCSGEEWTDSSPEIENLTPDFFRAAYMVCANRGFSYLFYPGHPRGYPEKIRYEDMLPICWAHNIPPVHYKVPLYRQTWNLMDDWFTTSQWTPYWKNAHQVRSFSDDVKLGVYQKPDGETLLLAANVSTERRQGEILIFPESLGFHDGQYTVVPSGPEADGAATFHDNRISVEIPRLRCRFFLLRKETTSP